MLRPVEKLFCSLLKFKIIGDGGYHFEKRCLYGLCFSGVMGILLKCNGVGVGPVVSIVNGERPTAF